MWPSVFALDCCMNTTGNLFIVTFQTHFVGKHSLLNYNPWSFWLAQIRLQDINVLITSQAFMHLRHLTRALVHRSCMAVLYREVALRVSSAGSL